MALLFAAPAVTGGGLLVPMGVVIKVVVDLVRVLLVGVYDLVEVGMGSTMMVVDRDSVQVVSVVFAVVFLVEVGTGSTIMVVANDSVQVVVFLVVGMPSMMVVVLNDLVGYGVSMMVVVLRDWVVAVYVGVQRLVARVKELLGA